MFQSISSFRDNLAGFSLQSFRSFRGLIGSSPNAAAPEPLHDRFPRLIERNLPYHQSRNKIYIKHRNARKPLYQLLRYNWFHVFLQLKTTSSLTILLLLWTAMIVAFALLYHVVDAAMPNTDCGLGDLGLGVPITLHGAFGFSLETATTVGYSLPGTSNALFENCVAITVAIYFQMMLSMMFNTFLFAFFFARLAKSESRAIQVVFSDKCVVRETERGSLVCQLRVYGTYACMRVCLCTGNDCSCIFC